MREWIYTTLNNHIELGNLVASRIHQSSDVTSVPENPFVLYTMGLRTNARVSTASRWPLQVWAHDKLGSYLRIDEILGHVKNALLTTPPSAELLQVHWLEDSGDLRDDEMRTITRFSRFQLVMSTGGGE